MKIKSTVKKIIPWWLKITAKIVLSQLPIKYDVWRKIHLFQHGLMHSPKYAYSVFMDHLQLTEIKSKFTCLELGPGDSLFSALMARALGAEKILLVDADDFCCRDMDLYRVMYEFLLEHGYNLKVDLSNFETFMHSCGVSYLTSGLSSLKEIPDKSIDFIFSNAVLEHIRKSEFLPTLKELHRILKPTGICSHVIDLRDHLGGGLNHLRFSDLIWESDLFVKSGFYTNRVRLSEMLNLFKAAGFKTKIINKTNWTKLPIERNKLYKKFQRMSDQNLNVATFKVLLRSNQEGKLSIK